MAQQDLYGSFNYGGNTYGSITKLVWISQIQPNLTAWVDGVVPVPQANTGYGSALYGADLYGGDPVTTVWLPKTQPTVIWTKAYTNG